MPTYEYRCEGCGRTLEVVQSFTESPLTTCEHCGGQLRKVYAPVGIVFKGSGFYKTDSRGSAKREAQPGASSNGDKATEKSADASSASTATSGSSESSGSSDSSGSKAAPPSSATPSAAPAGTPGAQRKASE